MGSVEHYIIVRPLTHISWMARCSTCRKGFLQTTPLLTSPFNMLALQTAPLHLRDQDKQERRFDQSLLFNGYTSSSQATSHHPRQHSYHPTGVSPVCITPSSALSSVLPPQHPLSIHPHQALFYRECDLQQDLSIAGKVLNHTNNYSKPSHFGCPPTSTTAAVTSFVPRTQSCTSQDDMTLETPIRKMEARIAQMTVEDCEKEKIVLLLTGTVLRSS
ncbi:MAG: hypothetical protein J3Q66DRAFT_355436 [Benniella sp.]|nr:MAG: hypothetical protein J3Q66DRAFT_355436 [Benniella sp.]